MFFYRPKNTRNITWLLTLLTLKKAGERSETERKVPPLKPTSFLLVMQSNIHSVIIIMICNNGIQLLVG